MRCLLHSGVTNELNYLKTSPLLKQNCGYEIKQNNVTINGESIFLYQSNIDKIPASTSFKDLLVFLLNGKINLNTSALSLLVGIYKWNKYIFKYCLHIYFIWLTLKHTLKATSWMNTQHCKALMEFGLWQHIEVLAADWPIRAIYDQCQRLQ